jgi:hypothetical protein
MLASHKQIVESYEQMGMLPEEIAVDQELEIVAVKAVLMQESSLYRKDCKKDISDKLNFNESEDEEMKNIILDCARSATLPDGSVDHRTRLKAATYVRDDRRGRLEPARMIQKGPTLNLLTINESIQQARVSAERVKKQLIDVQEVQVQ